MLDLVLARLRDEYEFADKISQFESLSPFRSGDQTGAGYQSASETLQLSREAGRVAAHRMRKRYRQILREEIAHIIATPQEVDDEIRHLLESLQRT